MKNSLLTQQPSFGYRGSIPLFYPKSDEESRHDAYEQYFTTVLRNVRNYYDSDFGEASIAFVERHLQSETKGRNIVELGCGVGYHLGRLASVQEDDYFTGFDMSYQMLKMADMMWLSPKEAAEIFSIPQSNLGYKAITISKKSLQNVEFALADASLLPLDDASVDVCFSCFLWDRIVDIDAFLMEQKRILKKGGKLIVITPFNYRHISQWEQWYPKEKLIEKVVERGWSIQESVSWNEYEKIDHHGNTLNWNVQGMVFTT